MMDLLKMKSFSAVKIVSGISGSHIICQSVAMSRFSLKSL